MKDYYFYPPKNPQFFFPKKKLKEYQHYYLPFSVKSKVFWFLYKNSFLVRGFFKIPEEEIPLPITKIKKIINLEGATCFYNLGTAGIEQSATIIAKNKEQQRFLKFAQKERSKRLVVNEAAILLELEKQTTFKTATVFDTKINDSYAYVLTEVIKGEKVRFTRLNASVFQLLLVLAKTENKKRGGLIEVFAHGDFCPWNMLQIKNKELVLIDWEMAGLKPLGYDLFTYIFQTSFLLYPTKSISTIILENQEDIANYFKEFKIIDWNEYLIKFASSKETDEKRKPNSLLLPKYQELRQYNG